MTKDYFNLKDKVVIITGGAGLIGKAYVEVCALYGARVFLADIDDKTATKVVDSAKSETKNINVYYQRCNIADKNDIKNLIDVILKKCGRVDALVNNAYPKNKNYGRKYESVTYENFCENVDLHLGGYFL